jgi:hypothetical protein
LFGLDAEARGLREDIKKLLESIGRLTVKESQVKQEVGYTEQIIALKKRITDLEISEAKIAETHAREDRELRHMIGLEKKRQEVETAQAKREATLAVREENLAAERKRFEDTIESNKKALEDGFGYMREVLKQVMDRLPTVTVSKKG